ncbi:hypothetical protein, partial [Thermocrinis sp.]|jgi:hypothetical protein|uniref:hypothetical protein n=1 Tax=Thermocrinis sp. TaxID=2024383 RepID=UPI003C0AABD4
VEIIVNVAFGAIPSILGIGAAGLLGSGIINTARDVVNSISLLRTVGPTMEMGWKAGKGLNTLRKGTAERLKQYNHPVPQFFGNFLTPVQWYKSKRRKNNQDTQGKQDEQSGGGSGGSPPVPPDIRADKKAEQAKTDIKTSDKKEERPKPTGIETYSPIDALNPFKKKE